MRLVVVALLLGLFVAGCAEKSEEQRVTDAVKDTLEHPPTTEISRRST